MKKNLLAATLGAVVLGFVSMSASAQTCAGPQMWQPPVGGETISGVSTCGGDTTATAYCFGNQDAPGPAYVFQSNFSSGRTFTTISLTGGTPSFNPVMYMSAVSGGCGTNAPCGPSGDSGFPIQTADVADGDWFIIVTAASIDSAGACGDFTITSNGSFPVTLTNFTVS
ncbi:MAG: hypothetical protein F9K31_01425 [Dokdonella sp.]|nr:MAG: hypothetical protein F9K31_01425 [Dokdonella sp.]MCZ2075769.1 hypothetical protein [Bryobacterales bacterium]RIK35682.1 MAG: hypothetical protein DCC58_20225 [Chloroflexota bacterium]